MTMVKEISLGTEYCIFIATRDVSIIIYLYKYNFLINY